MEQPVLCPQRLNLLHREGWSPAHSPVVCPYTFYIIAVAVAIGRELTHPTNVANLHAVVVQTCGNHHFRMCRVSFLHVAVQQSQGTVGIAAYRIEAFHTFLQSISTVIAPVSPWPILIAFTILFYMAAQEVVIVVVQTSICDAKESPLEIDGIIDNAISSIKMCFILQNVLHKNNTPI